MYTNAFWERKLSNLFMFDFHVSPTTDFHFSLVHLAECLAHSRGSKMGAGQPGEEGSFPSCLPVCVRVGAQAFPVRSCGTVSAALSVVALRE